MNCDLCGKNEASIFVEQTGRDGNRKANLCINCAAEHGIAAPFVSSDNALLNVLFKKLDFINGISELDEKRVCPGCGRRLSDIKKFGTAGCSECYEVFKGDIRSSMERHNINGTYTGSMPKRVGQVKNTMLAKNDLIAKLEFAVKEENYEKAAIYRDFIRALEKGSVADGSDDLDVKNLEDAK